MTDSMTSEERVLAAINLQPTDRVPCGVDLSYFVANHSKVTVAEFLANMDLQMDLQHRVFEELNGIDYVHPFPSRMMIDQVAGFMAMPMLTKLPGKELPPNEIPQYNEVEIMPQEGYDILLEKSFERYAREDLTPRFYGDRKALGLTYDEEGDYRFFESKNAYYPRIGPPAMLPFDLFSFTRSLEKFTADLYRRPDKVIAAMDAIMPELIGKALSGIKKPGNPVLLPASRSSNGFISPKQFERFVLPYLNKFVNAIVGQGSPVFFHLDQTWTKFLPYFQQFPQGKYVLHFDGMTDLVQAKALLGNRMCIMGDVPATIFKLGTPESMRAYCQKLIGTIGKGGGFILSAGCGVPGDAKFENVQAMIETANNYRTPD
jgi:hypothetical protein